MFEYARGIGDFLYVGLHNIMFALIFVGAGVWSNWRGIRNKTNLAYMRRQLVAWKVSMPEASLAAPLIVQATSAVARLRGWGLIAAGSAVVLDVLCWMGFALITNINPTHDQGLLGVIFNTSWLVILLGGYGVGHAAGVWRLRRRAQHQPAYGDIRRRSLADYRAPIIGWLCPAMALAWIIFTALTLPHVQTADVTPTYLDPHSPALLVEGLALPALMVAITIIMELLLHWVAQLPRLLIVPDPALAQRADDIVRATTIGALQGWEFILVSTLGASQWNLLNWHLPPNYTEWPLSGIFDCSFALLLGGVAIYLFAHGRLGGALTGWPWRLPR